MKKTFLILIALFCMMLLSCNQDPIFYNISIEPPKKDPTIAGSPTSIIVLNDMIYAGSKHGRKIHRNDGGSWLDIPAPGGSVIDIATDKSYLYALVYDGSIMNSTAIKRYDPGTESWENNLYSLAGHSIQSIYGAGTEIFAGSYYQTSEGKWTYAILCHDGTSLEIIKPDTSLLRGAAEKTGVGIFLATAGGGIFRYNGIDVAGPIEGTTDIYMVGIIENKGTVFAVSNDSVNGRNLYIYDATSQSFSANSIGLNLTGAMCVWNQHDSSIQAVPLIKVNPSQVTVKKGSFRQFSALTEGFGDTDDSVAWSLSGSTKAGTGIDNDGLLTVDADETPGWTLTVTASSVEDSAVTGTARVVIADTAGLDGFVTISFSGNLEAGSVLAADTTELGGTGTLSYQWKRNGELISDAGDSEEYTLTLMDQGEDINVTVSRVGMEGSVSSGAVTFILPGDDPWKPALLLVGIRGSVNYQGYREILLNRFTGRPDSFGIRMPGDNSPSSVTDRAKYNAGIGKHPVEAILQAPGEMFPSAASETDIPIFASTTLNGLWSYRDGEWNAEE